MATNNTKFLGFERSQLPMVSLLLTLAGIIITLQIETRAEIAALRADNAALRADNAALRADSNANDNALRAEIAALRSDMNANDKILDSRVDALAVEMGEMNARLLNVETRVLTIERYIQSSDARIERTAVEIENIETSLPDYAAIDARLDALERGQTLLTDRVDALAASPPE